MFCYGSGHCPLCNLLLINDGHCSDCVLNGCTGTPWSNFNNIICNNYFFNKDGLFAADNEIEFLENIRYKYFVYNLIVKVFDKIKCIFIRRG